MYIGIIEKWVKDSKPKTYDNQLRTLLTFYRFSKENYRQIVNLLNVASGGKGRRLDRKIKYSSVMGTT